MGRPLHAAPLAAGLAVLLRLASAGGAPGGEPPPSEAEIAREVDGLGAEDFERRERAAAALEAWAVRHPARVLKALPAEPEPEVEQRCGRILDLVYRRCVAEAKEPHPERDEFLPLLLRHPDPEVRLGVLGALRAHPSRAASPAVAGLLPEKDPEVVASALETLGALGDRSLAGRVRPFLEDKRIEARRAALGALRRIGGEEDLPRAARFLGDVDPLLRREAILAVGDLGERRHIALLGELLGHESPEVQYLAAGAIEKLLGRPPRGDLDEARKWWAAHKGDPEFRTGK